MILSEESFIRTLDFIKDRAQAQHQMNQLFRKEFEDSFFWPYNKYETAILKVLEEIFQDTENKWIDYFVYELEFGTKWKPFTVTEKDSNGNIVDVPLGTPQQLYKCLVNNINN